MKAQPRDYGRLKELLESQESFPLQFTFKVIGKNTPKFEEGLKTFQAQFPSLVIQTRRESSEGGHVSVTFSLLAQNAAEITWMYEQASEIQDVTVLL